MDIIIILIVILIIVCFMLILNNSPEFKIIGRPPELILILVSMTLIVINAPKLKINCPPPQDPLDSPMDTTSDNQLVSQPQVPSSGFLPYCPFLGTILIHAVKHSLLSEAVSLAENCEDEQNVMFSTLVKRLVYFGGYGLIDVKPDKLEPLRNNLRSRYNQMTLTLKAKLSAIDGFSFQPSGFDQVYENLGFLGRGAFGYVCKVTNKVDNNCYAVKAVPFFYKLRDQYKMIRREIEILSSLPPHPNLVEYKVSWLENWILNQRSMVKLGLPPASENSPKFTDPTSGEDVDKMSIDQSSDVESEQSYKGPPGLGGYFYILMELCDKNLKGWLNARNGRLTSKDRQMRSPLEIIDLTVCFNILKQILIGVKVIHDNHVIHRDLKPENILLGLDGNIKVGDLGLSKKSNCKKEWDSLGLSIQPLDENQTVGVGTPVYAAPEQMVGPKYDQKVDIYSLGLVALEIFYPFQTEMEILQAFDDLARKRSLPSDFSASLPDVYYSQAIAKLILVMTSPFPNDRPDASQILTSGLFAQDGHGYTRELAILKSQLVKQDDEIRRQNVENAKLREENMRLKGALLQKS